MIEKDIVEWKKHQTLTVNNVSKELLSDILALQQEVISSPIRFNGVSVENIEKVFERYGIKIFKPF